MGSTLIDECLKLGMKVRCLDLLFYGNESLKDFEYNKNFELIKGDIRKKDVVEKSLENIDIVVHLAAIVGDQPCLVAPQLAYQVNYLGTKNLIDISIKKKIKKFIFASTCSNYGISSNESLASENSVLNPVSLYAETKIDCEKLITDISTKDLNCYILRFATAFGVSKRTRFDLLINSFTYEAKKKKSLFIFGENTWRPYIHVIDMSKYILRFILLNETDEVENINSIFNAGYTNQNYTKKNLTKFIIKYLPDTEIHYSNDVNDKRNYKVSFKKIEKFLNQELIIDVNKGFKEIINFIDSNKNIDRLFNNSNLNALSRFFSKKNLS